MRKAAQNTSKGKAQVPPTAEVTAGSKATRTAATTVPPVRPIISLGTLLNFPAPAPKNNAQLRNGSQRTNPYAEPTTTQIAAKTPTAAATGKNLETDI